MFRSAADVVLKDDLRNYLNLPAIRGGQRKLVTAAASPMFRAYQKELARRIEKIQQRSGRPRPGDDILLAVITDGRHAAIDMRLVSPDSDNEPDSKLNRLIENVHRIWAETAERRYTRPDGTPYSIPGAGQLIFSDLGTPAVEAKRGFSAYRWIKTELTRRGIPASEIAFMQGFKRSADKQRLFNQFNTGHIRVLIGSSETMGTGVNVQQRLQALHHLDVPWLPSQIEQREGRIERQGNQHDEIELYAYATLGSMDATMWQSNERKARFIAAALSGDRSVRRVEDIDSQANQFAMAKAIASGDSRLIQKPGWKARSPGCNASGRRISTTSTTSAAIFTAPATTSSTPKPGSQQSIKTSPAAIRRAATHSRCRSVNGVSTNAGSRAARSCRRSGSPR
jgi:Helicase conserved C-terminal domain